MRKEAHLKIYGIVQGVFYRDFTQEQAAKLSLTGWVRNMADGTVEAVVQGEEESIKKLINWCYEGPSSAKVNDIKVEWKNAIDEELDSFGIRY